MATSGKLIQVKDLRKHYNKGAIKALDGVSVDINRGDVMVVIGPSGSGKSTFLRSLNLLEQPTSGSIFFDGVDITKKKDENGKKIDIDLHRQKMGMVFQHFNLFPHMTILQNMTIAPVQVKKLPEEQAKAKAMELLAYEAATTKDAGGRCTLDAAAAKLFATEKGIQICLQAQAVFGGNGMSKEYDIERLVRDIRVWSVMEGSTEILRMIVSGTVLSK